MTKNKTTIRWTRKTRRLHTSTLHQRPTLGSTTSKTQSRTLSTKICNTTSNRTKKYNRLCRPNLTCLQNNALRNLTDHPKYIVVEADKNMGTVLMEREKFINQVIAEHLGNRNVYKNYHQQTKAQQYNAYDTNLTTSATNTKRH